MGKFNLSSYAPVGLDLKTERRTLWLGLSLSLFYSLFFFAEYRDACGKLYNIKGGDRYLIPGATMPDFGDMIWPYLAGFGILVLVMLLFIFNHYSYHRQESQSIYLMRRLSDPWELHRRCLTLPLLSAGLCLLFGLLVLLIYFAVYMIATPEECLTPHQWQKIWR